MKLSPQSFNYFQVRYFGHIKGAIQIWPRLFERQSICVCGRLFKPVITVLHIGPVHATLKREIPLHEHTINNLLFLQ